MLFLSTLNKLPLEPTTIADYQSLISRFESVKLENLSKLEVNCVLILSRTAIQFSSIQLIVFP